MLTALLGAALVVLTLLYVRSAFGFAYGLAAGVLLLGVARWLPEGASSFVLRLLGVTSLLYAPWDVTSDLILRSVPASDASALARMTGIPSLAWGPPLARRVPPRRRLGGYPNWGQVLIFYYSELL